MPTDEAIIRRLAEMRGYDWRPEDYCVRFIDSSGTVIVSSPWNPLASYDTAYECMLALPEEKRGDFVGHLECKVLPGKRFNYGQIPHAFALVAATPRQLSTAMYAALEEK